ncbi:MAG: (2Fe-2S)-binding protein [Minwuiales bacterium]|nr:(2Fe-2S)-binding protein [Minwuiales bacterium]
MYVCLCNEYRDTEIRQMAREGFTCAVKAYMALGDGPSCGDCLEFAQQIVDEVQSEQDPPPALVAAE